LHLSIKRYSSEYYFITYYLNQYLEQINILLYRIISFCLNNFSIEGIIEIKETMYSKGEKYKNIFIEIINFNINQFRNYILKEKHHFQELNHFRFKFLIILVGKDIYPKNNDFYEKD